MSPRFDALPLTPESIGVLKEMGVSTLDALAEASVTDIQSTFIKAAKEGRYPDKFPSLVKIASWVEQARTLAEKQPEGGPSADLDDIPTAVVKPATQKKRAYSGSGPQSYVRQMELRPERHRPRKDLAQNEQASGERVTPTPRREEGEKKAVVEELNPDQSRALHTRRQAPVLRKATSDEIAKAAENPSLSAKNTADTPVRTTEPSPSQTEDKEQHPAPASSPGESAEAPFRSFDDYKQGRVRVKPLDRHTLKTGEDTSRSTSSEQESFEEEQIYKKRMPIWRIRGVKHPDGMRVYLGAFITATAIFLTLAVAVGAAVFPIYLEDRRWEFAGLFFLTLFFWGLYVITAIGMRCRVCSCHLFYSRRCLKNVKAHRILGAFPMLAQTIHILFWRWFRCMYCGTAVRLKDDR